MTCRDSITPEAKLKGLWRDYQQASQGDAKASKLLICVAAVLRSCADLVVFVQLSKEVLAKFLILFKDTFHKWQGNDEVLGES